MILFDKVRFISSWIIKEIYLLIIIMDVSEIAKWQDFGLSDSIIRALEDNEFHHPLPIQVQSMNAAIVNDKHILGAAQTGSGKTLAYSIPMINNILKNRTNPCLNLKKRLVSKFRNEQDFEINDGDLVTVEEIIIDPDHTIGITESEWSCPEAIVLVPTRELAVQVKEEIDKICKYTNIRTCCLVGGLSQAKQTRVLNKYKPQILIATPGRLYDMVENGGVNHVDKHSIACIRTLVVDEGDRMMQKGHFNEMIKLIDIIKDSKKYRDIEFIFRVYLFSATLIFIHELPERYRCDLDKKKVNFSQIKGSKNSNNQEINKKGKINQMLSILGIDKEDTSIIDINSAKTYGRPDSRQLKEYKIHCTTEEKDLYLYYFLTHNKDKRAIIFCNSKTCLRRLSNILKYLGIQSLKLYADMDQKKRLSSLETFRTSNKHVLVATDVAARGLDIKDLDCVVHYQVPKICESYIHRSGRTARLNKLGICLTLCEPKEITLYKRLCNTINSGKEFPDYDVDINIKRTLKQRVDLAQQCDIIDHRLRNGKSDHDWFSKAAKECDIELDEEDFRRIHKGKLRNQNEMDNAADRRRLAVMQKKLNGLLKRKVNI